MSLKNAPRFVMVAVVAALALLGVACTSTTEPQVSTNGDSTVASEPTAMPDPTSEPEATAVEGPTAMAESALADGEVALDGQRTNWTGVIDGSIDMSLWLEQQGAFIGGEITYDAEPISVFGRSFPDGGYFLHEFGPDGKVSGTMSITDIVAGVSQGAMWGDKPMQLELAGVESASGLFSETVEPGDYLYAFSPFEEPCCGPEGFLGISEVTESEITIEFSNVTSGPAFNLAIIQPTTVPLNGNVGRFELVDDFRDCAFEIEVFGGFAYVQHPEQRFDCGFGNNASVEGIYVLVRTP